MRNRVPVPASERPPIPEFTPVPRKYRREYYREIADKAGMLAPAEPVRARRGEGRKRR